MPRRFIFVRIVGPSKSAWWRAAQPLLGLDLMRAVRAVPIVAASLIAAAYRAMVASGGPP